MNKPINTKRKTDDGETIWEYGNALVFKRVWTNVGINGGNST